jgi:SAM-dependent methyltransferase
MNNFRGETMDFNSIDWNALWEAESHHSHWNKTSPKELWNKRAASFSQRITRVVDGKEDLDKDDYIVKMLGRIAVKPEWSVLDIGCGPGTLSIPLAKIAKSVTALDISSEMLKYLRANAVKTNLDNIRYVNTSWQDAFAHKLVGKHDIVVASRSLLSGDMQEALRNIIDIAGQAAFITFPIIHLPFDWEVYRAIGRNGKKHPPYIYIYNLLFQMGIIANVEVLLSRVKVQFSDIEKAIEELQWRTDPFTPEERLKLTEFLKKKLAESQDSKVFTHEGYSKWALIWWRKDEQF